MKIKLDENVPAQLKEPLGQLGHDVDSVVDEELSGFPDSRVWDAAKRAGRFLITQDLDFSDVRVFPPGSHVGLLLLRLHNPNRRTLMRRIEELFASEATDNWRGCLVVATEHKVRVLRWRPGRRRS